MSLNKIQLSDMYLNNNMSISDISNQVGLSQSAVRYRLIKGGVKLRERSEGVRLARGKMSIAHKGKKKVFTDEWKKHISEAKKRYYESHAKGYDIHQGYKRCTTGKNCGRLEHVVLMELHIGRPLRKNEVVHHINGNRQDNRIENLQLLTRVEHSRMHAIESQGKARDCVMISLKKQGVEKIIHKLN